MCADRPSKPPYDTAAKAKPDMRLLLLAADAAVAAGDEILRVYARDFDVEAKADQSPLTEADRAAHTLIAETMQAQTPYPLLSEEGTQTAYEQRADWRAFWLVDPLDGTKEFVKRNGEFTVNIALVDGTRPVLGVVYAPVRERLYLGLVGKGAWRWRGSPSQWRSRPVNQLPATTVPLPVGTSSHGLRVVASRSHCNEQTETFISELERTQERPAERVSIGSSLKLCLVAEGTADVYPRIAPTMEWDTAAAHAVVTAAGGRVISHPEGTLVQYNKPDLHNPHFVVYGPDWRES